MLVSMKEIVDAAQKGGCNGRLEDDDSAYFGDPGTEGDPSDAVEGTEGSGGERDTPQ